MEYAHELLEELHPLEKTPFCEAFPWFGAMVCYQKRQEAKTDEADNEAQLLNEKPKTVTINGKEIVKKPPKKKKNNIGEAAKANPIAQLGFGIVAYVDMLWCLIWTFTLYTVLLLPTFMFYGEGKAYDDVPAAVKSTYLDSYLGNLGYSSVQCAQIPLSVEKLALSCPYGVIGEYLDYGVNTSLDDKYVCMTNDVNSGCTPNAPHIQEKLDELLNDETGLIDFKDKSLYTNPAQEAACNVEDATLFVQYTCIQDEASQAQKYDQLALAVATAVLISFLFTVSIRSMYQGGKIQQLEWDMSTVTAGDYSVELPISKDTYMNWKENEYRKPGGDFENQVAPAISLKRQLKKEIEESLDNWVRDNKWARDQLYGKKKGEGHEYEGTKVADIVFSFNNARLIEALRARGQQIAAQDFDKMREEEQRISALFQEFDSLTVPTSAFITFENDDSASFADMVTDSTDEKILGAKMHFENCSEPTDIIWENRHFTDRDYVIRQTFAFVIIGILLFASMILIYWISAFSADMATVFPNVDCGAIEATYGEGSALQPYAVDDYDYIQGHPGDPSSGCLQCFCQQQYKDGVADYDTASYGQADGDAICGYYQSTVMSVYLWTTALSYLLIGINYVLRTVCIMLVDWIGFSTETVRLSKTTTITWVVQWFNSAFLLLMVNANLSEQPITFWLTSGSLPDFNSAWFRSVGDIIVAAMIFNVYYPLLEFVMFWGLRFLYRCLDRGCKIRKDGTTKSTSIQGYINLYQGPLYFMHYKYSSILTIAYITFMYGFGMPVLFPIAMLSFLVLYFVEKLMLFYSYVMPPMYDERLSNDVLSKLQFAPLLYVIFGYWMASNMQLISNEHLTAVESSTSIYITSHTMGTAFSGVGWEGIKWPLYIAFIFLFIIFFFGEILVNWLCDFFPNLRIGDVELNEDIDNYWKSLDEEDHKWSLREEENARNALKMSILTDDQFDKLKNREPTTGKTLQGVHSYDILANPLYLDDFQYVTAAEDDRAEMIIDDDDDEGNDAAQSDLVRLSLNLAYMSEEQARNFKFDKNAMKSAIDSVKPHSLN